MEDEISLSGSSPASSHGSDDEKTVTGQPTLRAGSPNRSAGRVGKESRISKRRVPRLSQLSCLECKSRKIKCNRTRPSCARCAGLGCTCVYPDSRQKQQSKRHNVRELEIRLGEQIHSISLAPETLALGCGVGPQWQGVDIPARRLTVHSRARV